MIGEQKKAGILDTANRIAALNKKVKVLEQTLSSLLDISNSTKTDLDEYEDLLGECGYDGIYLFYINRRRREIDSIPA